jgi:recombinational DNA repair ATPase RecF
VNYLKDEIARNNNEFADEISNYNATLQRQKHYIKELKQEMEEMKRHGDEQRLQDQILVE